MAAKNDESSHYEIIKTEKDKYVAYRIHVQVGTEKWFVMRRYKEFRNVYDVLRKAYPEANFKIPPKKFFGNFSSNTINSRVKGLNELVMHMVSTKGVLDEDIAKEFLRTNDIRNKPLCAAEMPQTTDQAVEDPSDTKQFADNLGQTYNGKLTPDDFEFRKVIGKGSFGRVYLAQHNETGQIYAIKVLLKNKLKSSKEKIHLMSERNVLRNNLCHPFLVSLHYSFQTPSRLYFVLDYVNGGELFYHLQKEKRFTEERAKFYAAEIACALGYLHSRHVIYRDLKPENLLLDRYGHIVITDFGLAKEKMDEQDGYSTRTFCGTPEYLAPEVLLKQPYSYTMDWWCLGSVLYEMIFGAPPFYDRDQPRMYEAIKNREVRLERGNVVISEAAKCVLLQMLKKKPQERLGHKDDVREIESHVFFQSLDFAKLERKEVEVPFVPNIQSDDDISNIDVMFLKEAVPDSVQVAVTTDEPGFIGFTYTRPMGEFV